MAAVGYVFWAPLKGVLRPLFQGDDMLSAGVVLIGMTVLASFAGAISLFLLLARITRNTSVAVLVTVAYLGTNAPLSYSLTGMAYVAGIGCQIGALYLLQNYISSIASMPQTA